MEEFKKLPIAIKKADLPIGCSKKIFSYEYYKLLIESNRKRLRTAFEKRNSLVNLEFLEILHEKTRLNGALDIRKLLTDSNRTGFFDYSDRLSCSETHTRGYTYIVSLDKGLTATEKLLILKKDIFEALLYLEKSSSPLEKFAISDYIKNALLTILNALLSQEKIGKFDFGNEEYQNVRTRLIDATMTAVEFHYQFFFKTDDSICFEKNFREELFQLIGYLEKKSAKRYGRIEGSALSRPEASHPLVIFYSSMKLLFFCPNIETIIGLPSGGTELALVTGLNYKRYYGFCPEIILFPLSLHSAKDVYGEQAVLNFDKIKTFWEKHKTSLSERTVLVCDDNSSTGKTLQYLLDSVEQYLQKGKIIFSVAEADIIRTLIDRNNPKRKYIANPMLFEHSVSVLPVSSYIQPKSDLKEIQERREIIRYHRQKLKTAKSKVDEIYHEIFISAAEENTADVIEKIDKKFILDNFHGTKLSNFYATPIELKNVQYPSVEHAYQHQKFSEEALEASAPSIHDEIVEAMRARGYGAAIIDVRSLFTDPTFNAGNIKIVADILRKHGLGRSDWARLRVKTMIELLLCKFSKSEMRQALVSTGHHYLIEGNDWNDFLWGFCRGHGKNLMGRILMNLRERYRNDIEF